LRFGENAQKIKNKPKINRELTVQELQKIVEKLEEEGRVKELKIRFLEKYIKEKLNGELPDYKEISGLMKKL
jgi:kinesin family protein 5